MMKLTLRKWLAVAAVAACLPLVPHTAVAASSANVKRRGDYWITLLGEVPPATLQQFASAIEYKASR